MPSAKAIKARNRKYYKRNAESIRSQSRDNYKKNPLNKKAASCDYSKAHYSADPQKVRAAPSEKYNINPEPKMEASHGQYSTHSETIKAAPVSNIVNILRQKRKPLETHKGIKMCNRICGQWLSQSALH